VRQGDCFIITLWRHSSKGRSVVGRPCQQRDEREAGQAAAGRRVANVDTTRWRHHKEQGVWKSILDKEIVPYTHSDIISVRQSQIAMKLGSGYVG
jgi:hypothetical protein